MEKLGQWSETFGGGGREKGQNRELTGRGPDGLAGNYDPGGRPKEQSLGEITIGHWERATLHSFGSRIRTGKNEGKLKRNAIWDTRNLFEAPTLMNNSRAQSGGTRERATP